MKNKDKLQEKTLLAARDTIVNSVLFRNVVARKLGLNSAESACVNFLSINGISSPKEIAQFTGLTSGSTTAMLDRLEKKRFIVRKPNPDDRRGVLVEINYEHAQIAKKLVGGIQKSHHELLESYSEKELELIADFLTKFSTNIVTATKEIEKKLNSYGTL